MTAMRRCVWFTNLKNEEAMVSVGPQRHMKKELTVRSRNYYFFLILAHPVYKMWIKQEPNKLELWNKLYFEEKETESVYHV